MSTIKNILSVVPVIAFIVVVCILSTADSESEKEEKEIKAIVDSSVPVEEAYLHVGEQCNIRGTVYDVDSSYDMKTGVTTFINMGGPKGDKTHFYGVIFSDDIVKFNGVSTVEKNYEGQEIVVSGTVQEYEGSTEIKVFSPNQIICTSTMSRFEEHKVKTEADIYRDEYYEEMRKEMQEEEYLRNEAENEDMTVW